MVSLIYLLYHLFHKDLQFEHFFFRLKGGANFKPTPQYKKRVLTRKIVYSLVAFTKYNRIAF